MKNKQGITKKLLVGLFCALVSGSGYASAMPTGAHDLQNISGITRNGGVMDIAGKGNAVAKWQDFSLKQGETINFKGMQNVLNIVDGNKFSDIRGTINGQGINVFLVNPSGVLFGDTSKVNVGSLTVSTQEVSKNLAEEFTKNGTITTDVSKLGIGDVTFVGSVNADSIKVTGNNISLVNTDTMNAQNVSLTTPSKGFINVLKGQDTSKLNVAGGSIRDDFEAVDSQEKLKGIKSDGRYMLTKDITLDGSWSGIDADKTEVVKDDETRNVSSNVVVNGMGHSIGGFDKYGLFQSDSKLYDSEITNLTLEGEHYENHNEKGTAIIVDNAEGLKVDNLTSNIKTANTESENSSATGSMFSDIKYSNVQNVVVNTNYSFKENRAGNITRESTGTNYTNITNNGSGYVGIANSAYGGDLLNSVNNGNMNRAGFIQYYYNGYYDKNGKYVRPNINVMNNINNGDITADGRYEVAGIAGSLYFDGYDTKDSVATIKGNVNNGKITAMDTRYYAGGLFNYISHSSVNEKSNVINIEDNANHGDLTGYYVGGLASQLYGQNVYIRSTYNYGRINSDFTSGGLVGFMTGADIHFYDVANYGKVGLEFSDKDSAPCQLGGLVGLTSLTGGDLFMEKTRNYGTVIGGLQTGGLLGSFSGNGLSIKDSYNMGNLDIGHNGDRYGTATCAGGLGGNIHISKWGDDKGSGVLDVENVFNAGDIEVKDDAQLNDAGGLFGITSGSNEKTVIKNAFNTGNIYNTSQDSAGLIGSVQSDTIIENAYNTGNITVRKNSFEYTVGSLIGRTHKSIDLKNVYSSGDIKETTGEVAKTGLLGGVNEGSITLTNAYSTENPSTFGYKGDTATVDGEVKKVNGKKASDFAGFDLDATGKNKSATWRIYEGYSNPLLTVFMNDAELKTTDKKVIENGSEQSLSKGEVVKGNTYNKNIYTESIDYNKDSHIFDTQTENEFDKVSGTAVGKYSTRVYSDQLGFNFTEDNDTLTLEIEPAPVPTPSPEPTPAPAPSPVPEDKPVTPKMPVVNIGVDKIVKINVVNQTGSYKDMDYEEHTLLNEKEAARIEQVDEQNIVVND